MFADVIADQLVVQLFVGEGRVVLHHETIDDVNELAGFDLFEVGRQFFAAAGMDRDLVADVIDRFLEFTDLQRKLGV